MSWWKPVAPRSAPAVETVHPDTKALETALAALQGRFASLEQAGSTTALALHETRSVVDAHDARLKELLFAVSEGISKVERTENRIRAVVRRAREQLEDGGVSSPALDAEVTELRVVDGGASGPEQVQAVPAPVAAPDMSSIPGEWTEEDLRLLGAG